jgi:hypothetical protein
MVTQKKSSTRASQKVMTLPNPANKRKFIRFTADEGAQAFILGDESGKKFKIPLPALIIEESFKGCSLVVLQNSLFKEKARFHVKVGKLDVMLAEIRWTKVLAKKVQLLGLVFLE